MTCSVVSGLKNSGLVNISGFHVDPGKGKLLFAIFNGGPQTVAVCRDQNALMIWFAGLEGAMDGYALKKVVFERSTQR